MKVTENLATLYHHVCEVNGETPNRVLLDHVQGRRFRCVRACVWRKREEGRALCIFWRMWLGWDVGRWGWVC